jgi:hypothetical protein
MSTENRTAASTTMRAHLPVTRAVVNGIETELVLDLGAAHALTLRGRTLRDTGARPVGEHVTYTDAAGNVLRSEVFEVARLQWAGSEWRNVRAVQATWAEDFAPPVRLGVLGRPLFRDQRIRLDLGHDQVALKPTGRCHGARTPIDLDDGIVFTAHIGEHPASVLLDTAATHDIAMNDRFSGRHRLRLETVRTRGIELIHAPTIQLPFDILLGTPFLQRHVVELDFGARCLELR